jgi:hypothetical protein
MTIFRPFYAIAACIVLAASTLTAWGAEADGRARGPESSIYAYREDDIPEVFFFPKDKARWDGSRVTLKEWYTLTDLQKEKFISEYMEELKRQYGHGIDVVGLDYLKALNVFSTYADAKKSGESSTKFIDALLGAQGKAAQPGSRMK